MLPIRWILPIVGALFALALLPLAFSPRDTSRLLSNSVVVSNERPERRQTLVPLGIQRKELESRGLDAPAIDTVASLPAADVVTGSVDATTPVAPSLRSRRRLNARRTRRAPFIVERDMRGRPTILPVSGLGIYQSKSSSLTPTDRMSAFWG
jgi:hypothetical protein